MPNMKIVAATVQDYLDSLPDDRREALGTIRKLIKRIWPKSVEDMTYGMPTFHLDGHALCAIASQKHFMALYIMHYDLLLAFKHDLMVLDAGKSCIRFKRLEPALADLFDRILKYTGNQMATSRYYGKAENMRANGKAR
jgi:uncharacterized protein YdhG (YjbR/CyaY superfamily)